MGAVDLLAYRAIDEWFSSSLPQFDLSVLAPRRERGESGRVAEMSSFGNLVKCAPIPVLSIPSPLAKPFSTLIFS